MTGTVVTFYSYKGGVGRSFTLANVAVLLARWGYRVLALDWDLEAPGLHHYFGPYLSEPPRGGVIDLATDFVAGQEGPSEHAVRLDLAERGTVDLLAAGRVDSTYAGRVQSVDWEDLYSRGFASFLEQCREEWTENYDFVLIDSRTGISDIAGICTAHLPDRLVVLFTANDQSVDGAVEIARRANIARDRLPYDRPPHLVLPILSRLDNRVEYQRADFWQKKCAEATAELFRNWLAKSVTQEMMLRHLTVPYVSYWSFGEYLPVCEETIPSADQISFALETVAAVIAQQFDRTDLLADNRDAYVAAARSQRVSYDLDLLVSVPHQEPPAVAELVRDLEELGLRVERSRSSYPEWDQELSGDLAKHLCLVVDGEVSRWQSTEAERFLRHALDVDSDRQLFCVVTRKADLEQLPSFLRHLRRFQLDAKTGPGLVARQLHGIITDSPGRHTDSDHAALQEAAAMLRAVPGEVANPGRWALIDQTVRDMAAALDNADMLLLKDLTVDLEQLNHVRANGGRVAAPDGLQSRIGELLVRLDRRTKFSTK
ncbi:CATRA system-associated protein [Amycolatopsis sp. NBC_01286]|uniref:CATRA system-associated protein n=1 Tax=Amycolatopsis sp. NBC_01286 TaxID=2903560 RepID=UPI002E150AB4|nr:ATP/GTP-binding protein [Amycolatopsis sp. NBC_01286]